jgi:xanthine dehydrogenase accessory factor
MRRWLIVLLFAGCAGSQRPDTRPIATDPVCLYNRDLGCVRVHVDDQTPRAAYAGSTYYFCSASCRDTFLKDPPKYLPTN